MSSASISPPQDDHERASDEPTAGHRQKNRLFTFMDEVHRTWPLRWEDVRLLLACYAALTVVGVGAGMLITHVLDHSALVRTDQRVSEWFVDRRRPSWNTITFIGSQLADTVIKVAATVLVCGLMVKAWKRWLEPLIVALSLILEASAFITITSIVGRPRPDVPKLDGSPVGTAFPSGHVAAAVVYSAIVVVVFWHVRTRWIRTLLVFAAGILPVVVGVARIYRGMHFLSDVVAGALLGIASVVCTLAVMRRAARREGQQTTCC